MSLSQRGLIPLFRNGRTAPVRISRTFSIGKFAVLLGLSSFALTTMASAAEVVITEATIAGGKLSVTGITDTANARVELDGTYREQSNAQKEFSYQLFYLPTDCIVEVGKVGSTTLRKAVVANCGPKGVNPQGAWKASTDYAVDDLVTAFGSSWIAIRPSLNRTPGTTSSYWEQFASKGDVGSVGPAGAQGQQGTAGNAGTPGTPGATGAPGAQGATGSTGAQGSPGATGATGSTGANGAQGVSGTVLAFGEFYALMPADNPATLAPGVAINFPNVVTSGPGISQITPNSFNLQAAGTYLIMYQATVTEAGQLILTSNGTELPTTVAGRATGASQIVGMSLVTTTSADTILQVVNPSANAVITLTPLAGGSHPVSAHVTILRLS